MSINEIGKVYERPWGTYKTIEMGDTFQVKIIRVKPGGQLSLQKHFKREEHWVVIEGKPTITVNDEVREYTVNETVHIHIEDIHRLENHTDAPVAIIEVQTGTYLGEDDIVRLEDVYNRQSVG